MLNQGPGGKLSNLESSPSISGTLETETPDRGSPQTCPCHFAVKECRFLPEPSYKTLLSWFQIS